MVLLLGGMAPAALADDSTLVRALHITNLKLVFKDAQGNDPRLCIDFTNITSQVITNAEFRISILDAFGTVLNYEDVYSAGTFSPGVLIIGRADRTTALKIYNELTGQNVQPSNPVDLNCWEVNLPPAGVWKHIQIVTEKVRFADGTVATIP